MADFLIISKPIEFDMKGRPVPGQCLPHTDGWRLIRISTDPQGEECIFTGFYDHCRALQDLFCQGNAGAMEAAKARFEAESQRRRSRPSTLLRIFYKQKRGN